MNNEIFAFKLNTTSVQRNNHHVVLKSQILKKEQMDHISIKLLVLLHLCFVSSQSSPGLKDIETLSSCKAKMDDGSIIDLCELIKLNLIKPKSISSNTIFNNEKPQWTRPLHHFNLCTIYSRWNTIHVRVSIAMANPVLYVSHRFVFAINIQEPKLIDAYIPIQDVSNVFNDLFQCDCHSKFSQIHIEWQSRVSHLWWWFSRKNIVTVKQNNNLLRKLHKKTSFFLISSKSKLNIELTCADSDSFQLINEQPYNTFVRVCSYFYKRTWTWTICFQLKNCKLSSKNCCPSTSGGGQGSGLSGGSVVMIM
jgi:hypothetical protein